MIYLDTGIIVRALLFKHPEHAECVRLISGEAVASCHSLAETFNTLTGFFKVANGLAREAITALEEALHFEPVRREDYLTVIADAEKRGVQGGIVYDALHAQVARRLRVKKLMTYNLTHFRHVAPDLEVASP